MSACRFFSLSSFLSNSEFGNEVGGGGRGVLFLLKQEGGAFWGQVPNRYDISFLIHML